MRFIAGTPVGVLSDSREIVEIKLWEVYLLNNRSDLIFKLNSLAVDHAPFEGGEHEPGRVSYRFSAYDWENEVRQLLYSNRIPVVVKPIVVHHDARPSRRHAVLMDI